jgi:hypothetical protein
MATSGSELTLIAAHNSHALVSSIDPAGNRFARLEPASNVRHLMLPGCDHHTSHPAQRQDAKSVYLNELHSALLLPLAIFVQP